VVRAAVSASEWLLAAPPAGSLLVPADLRLLAVRLLAAAPPGQPGAGRLAVTRVPQALIGPAPGPAVLHWRGGRAVAYCSDAQVTGRAAEALSALAGRAALLASPASPDLGIAAAEFTPVPHALLPPGLHPAAAFRRSTAITFAVCAELITADLAETLTRLFSAQPADADASYSAAGRYRGAPPGRQAGPGQDDVPRAAARPGTARRRLHG
jgi:hypothetical protein